MPIPLHMRAGLVAGTLVGILSACTVVGPNFSEPREPVPSQFAGAIATDQSADAVPQLNTTSDPDWQWWKVFHDAELDRLEEATAAGNLDLQAALARIVAARTEVAIARAQGLPSLSANASAMKEQLGLAGILKARGQSSLTSSPEAQGLLSSLTQPISLYQVGFDASWELDLFGKVSRSVEAANAQSAEVIESRNDALVSLEAEVAETYMQLRAAQVLRAITLQSLSDQRQMLELTKNRQFSGLGNQSQVEAVQAQLSTAESLLPQYDQTIDVSRHALAVLTGNAPNALDAELAPLGQLPPVPVSVPVGVPAALARRRPDVREAEAALHAATADVGVAVASLFPDVSLTGTYGLRNTSTQYLFNWASRFYTYGPTVSLPIFNGGALTGNVRVARAEAVQATLQYRKTVLSALQEVEDGLTALYDDARRCNALAETTAANRRSLALAEDSYRTGLITYISVLDAATQTIQAQSQLDQATLAETTDLVKLYKALGGGWQSDGVDSTQLAPVGTLGSGGFTAAPSLDAPPS
jgi:outer membrane protein, multidrug efflux system